MKKALKITVITLLSLLVVVFIVAAIACWIVFTPEKLTPIVRNVLSKELTCKTDVDKVDLTFFSTFPHFGLHLKNVTLQNPMPGSQSDTLAHLDDCTATIDLKAWWQNNAILLNKFYLKNGVANIYIDSVGNGNYNIVPPSDDTSAFSMPFDIVSLKSLDVKNLRASYVDKQHKMAANIDKLDISLGAQIVTTDGAADGKLSAQNVNFTMSDSTSIDASAESLNLKFDGTKENDDITGTLNLETSDLTFNLDSINYLKSGELELDIPLAANMETMRLALNKAVVTLNDHDITLDGWAQMHENDDINMDMDFSTSTWKIKQLLQLVPEHYATLLKDIAIDGKIAINGNAAGVFNDSLMPLLGARVNLTDATVKYSGLPYTFNKVNADVTAALNLNHDSISKATINSLSLSTRNSSATANGTVNDLLNTMLCNINLQLNLDLPDAQPMIPNDIKIDMTGRAKANVNAKFTVDDIADLNLEKIVAKGKINFTDLDVLYNDSIAAQTPQMEVDLTLPSPHKNSNFTELLQADIATTTLNADMLGLGSGKLHGAKLKVGISNFMDDKQPLALTADFDMNSLSGQMDTIDVAISHPYGSATLYPSKDNIKNTVYAINYTSDAISAKMGKLIAATTEQIKIKGNALYDESKKSILMQWNPNLDVNFNNGVVTMSELDFPVRIPSIKFNFTPDKFVINKSRIVIDRSDFNLAGTITNIGKWMEDSGLLKGDLEFMSNQTDVYQIIDIVSGFGATDSAEIAAVEEVPENKEDNPFMVPWGMDIKLKTVIKNAIVGSTNINNVAGNFKVKDGVLVLEQIGFTCDAATMQLTAIYRSERKNNLFCGLDFHLLNIEIDKLIDMIPAIDTIVPMLKSFKGKAEFHLAAETYLKSNYQLKYSTLRGAAAINGHDLVLLDGETFSTISKYLLFNKKTENKVDSLGVELTVFRNEVELYPFLMALDKYKVVVAGRYDLSKNYNAHIETMAPIRLGLDIKGNPNNMKFKLVKTQYADMYKPEKRNAVQERTLLLKQTIADALKANVKKEEDFED